MEPSNQILINTRGTTCETTTAIQVQVQAHIQLQNPIQKQILHMYIT